MISASAVASFRDACATHNVDIEVGDVKELILGVRSRLRDVAAGASCEEQVNAAIFVLHPLVAELRFASSGQGLDDDTLASWTWEVLLAAAGST